MTTVWRCRACGHHVRAGAGFDERRHGCPVHGGDPTWEQTTEEAFDDWWRTGFAEREGRLL